MKRLPIRKLLLLAILWRLFSIIPVTAVEDMQQPPTVTPTHVALNLFSPAISVLGFLQPPLGDDTDESIEWVMTIVNNSSTAGANVVISDTLRAELRVDRVATNRGIVTINGQTITVNITSLQPQESVQISIFTTTLSGATVENTACVRADNLNAARCATGQVVRQLPQTGESPFRLYEILALLIVCLMLWLSAAQRERQR